MANGCVQPYVDAAEGSEVGQLTNENEKSGNRRVEYETSSSFIDLPCFEISELLLRLAKICAKGIIRLCLAPPAK